MFLGRERDLSGERQLARTQQQKQKRRRGNRLGETACLLVREEIRPGRGVEVIGGQVGRSDWRGVQCPAVRAGSGIIKEKSFRPVVLRVMGLWGPGEGWSDPRDADGRACRSKAVEAEVEPTPLTCGSLS
jgi:hypothetical protein